MGEPKNTIKKLAQFTRNEAVSTSECVKRINETNAKIAEADFEAEGRLDEWAAVTCGGETDVIRGSALYVDEESALESCSRRGERISATVHLHPCGAAVPSVGDVGQFRKKMRDVDWFCVARWRDGGLKYACMDAGSAKNVEPWDIEQLAIEEIANEIELWPEEDYWETRIGGWDTHFYSEDAASRIEKKFMDGAKGLGIKVKEGAF